MATRDDVIVRMQQLLTAAGIDGATKDQCGTTLDVVLTAVKEVALEDGSVRTKIGTFRRKETEACTRRNPRTGDPVDVPAKTTLAFKAASSVAVVEAPVKAKAAKPAAKAAAPLAKKKVVAKKK
jgi:nucleoid DNA-binding protein